MNWWPVSLQGAGPRPEAGYVRCEQCFPEVYGSFGRNIEGESLNLNVLLGDLIILTLAQCHKLAEEDPSVCRVHGPLEQPVFESGHAKLDLCCV